MNEGLPKVKNLNEHLKPGVKPIIACVGTQEDFVNNLEATLDTRRQTNEILGAVQRVAYGNKDLAKEGFLVNETPNYVISPINARDKTSREYVDCTGMVVAGLDKETGENISFLTHQDPKKFLNEDKDKFTNDLKKRFAEIRDRCQPGTIDAVIFGGAYFDHPAFKNLKENYVNSIKVLSKVIEGDLGFEPVVINGPKIGAGWDNCIYDNGNRRLYMVRPEVRHTIANTEPPVKFKAINFKAKDFVASEIDKNKDDWKK